MDINIEFGEKCKDLFMVDKTICNVNVGSFGQTPKIVFEKLQEYQKIQYQDPDLWFRYQAMDKVKESLKIACDFVQAEVDQCVLMDTASEAMTTILNSLKISQKDKIVINSNSYPMIKATCKNASNVYGAQLVQIQFSREDIQTKEGILLKYKEILQQHQDVTLIVIEHISAFPTVIMPVAEIVDLLKNNEKIRVIVDGSQSCGQIDIDLKRINADFYIFNFTKWTFCPISICLLQFQNKYKQILEPSIVGLMNEFGFFEKFYWKGSRDITFATVVKEAIDFYNKLGKERMQKYNRTIAVGAGEAVAKIWGTEVLVKDTNMMSFFTMVIVPENDYKLVEKTLNDMIQKRKTYFVVFQFDGLVVARFGAQVYLEVKDYEQAALIFIEELKQQKLKNLQ